MKIKLKDLVGAQQLRPPPDLDEGDLIAESYRRPKQNIEVVTKMLKLHFVAKNCRKTSSTKRREKKEYNSTFDGLETE